MTDGPVEVPPDHPAAERVGEVPDGTTGVVREGGPARLGETFYSRPVQEVAVDLLGCVIRHGGVGVRLTEVEAYDGLDDPGSHAFRGPTPRTRVMFGPPGRLYVYFSYGMHHCVNVVCGPDGRASAVLLRAGEVVDGLEEARRRRTLAGRPTPPDRDLARGPARLTVALGLDRRHDGLDTTAPGSEVVLTPRASDPAPDDVHTGPRVGVSGPGGGADYPWRFHLDDPTVSPYRAAVRRRPPAAGKLDAADPRREGVGPTKGSTA